MAGEALSDPNYDARLRLSEDPDKAAERAALVGDQYDVSGFSDKEISMALKGGSFGDEDYARLTGKSMTDDAKPEDEPKPEPEAPRQETAPSPEPTPAPAETPNPTAGIVDQGITRLDNEFGRFGGLTQNVNQDNDIVSTVTGNNNTVTNNQDNSVNAYAGDAQRFTNDYIKRFTEKFA